MSHLTCLSVFSNHLGFFWDWITHHFSLPSPDFMKSPPPRYCCIWIKWLDRVVHKHCLKFLSYGFSWTYHSDLQSHHSIETALVKVTSYLHMLFSPYCTWLAKTWLTRPLLSLKHIFLLPSWTPLPFGSLPTALTTLPWSPLLVPSHFLTHKHWPQLRDSSLLNYTNTLHDVI